MNKSPWWPKKFKKINALNKFSKTKVENSWLATGLDGWLK
jgi:hypothetical protein